jgi:hypothetical protein
VSLITVGLSKRSLLNSTGVIVDKQGKAKNLSIAEALVNSLQHELHSVNLVFEAEDVDENGGEKNGQEEDNNNSMNSNNKSLEEVKNIKKQEKNLTVLEKNAVYSLLGIICLETIQAVNFTADSSIINTLILDDSPSNQQSNSNDNNNNINNNNKVKESAVSTITNMNSENNISFNEKTVNKTLLNLNISAIHLGIIDLITKSSNLICLNLYKVSFKESSLRKIIASLNDSVFTLKIFGIDIDLYHDIIENNLKEVLIDNKNLLVCLVYIGVGKLINKNDLGFFKKKLFDVKKIILEKKKSQMLEVLHFEIKE